jgi:hypothetical protein
MENTMNRKSNPNARRLSPAWVVIALLAVAAPATTLVSVVQDAERNVERGRYTGEITSGGPVYRLPALSVVADRKTELARIEREEQRQRERQARAKAGPDA